MIVLGIIFVVLVAHNFLLVTHELGHIPRARAPHVLTVSRLLRSDELQLIDLLGEDQIEAKEVLFLVSVLEHLLPPTFQLVLEREYLIFQLFGHSVQLRNLDDLDF